MQGSVSLSSVWPVCRWNRVGSAFCAVWFFLKASILSATRSQQRKMPRMHLTDDWPSSYDLPRSSSIRLSQKIREFVSHRPQRGGVESAVPSPVSLVQAPYCRGAVYTVPDTGHFGFRGLCGEEAGGWALVEHDLSFDQAVVQVEFLDCVLIVGQFQATFHILVESGAPLQFRRAPCGKWFCISGA